ncbi:MAG: peptidase [Caulobacter sp.]|nr:peptidase [Caulobacter sp.]
MSKFDVAAATAQYMATLSPEAHAKATAYTHGGEWVMLWSTVISILISWLVLRSGVLQRTRAGIKAAWLAVLAVVAVDGIIGMIADLPWSAYAGWWREKSYGLTSQPFGGWLADHFKGAGIGFLFSLIILSLLYLVIRRAPKTWWLWCGAGVGALLVVAQVVLVPLIQPIFNKYTPAPPGAVRDTVVAMAKQVGVPSDKIYIYDGSKQSNRYTANVAGLAGSARVAMSDVMFKKDADIAEVRGVVGHEMGHYVHQHGLWGSLAQAVLAMLAFFLADRLFMPVLRLTGAKGITGIADPAGLPVLGIILAVLGLLGTPLSMTITRTMESDADHFSVVNFNEPDGLSKALVKTIEYRASSPSALEEILFYDHPSVENRVRKAMEWKAAHMPPEAAAAPATGALATAPKPAAADDIGVVGMAAPKGSQMETVPSNVEVGNITFEQPKPKKK